MAYCLDQAVAHIGTTIRNDLEGVKGKNEKAIEAGRKRVLAKYFRDEDNIAKGYADPAMFFT